MSLPFRNFTRQLAGSPGLHRRAMRVPPPAMVVHPVFVQHAYFCAAPVAFVPMPPPAAAPMFERIPIPDHSAHRRLRVTDYDCAERAIRDLQMYGRHQSIKLAKVHKLLTLVNSAEHVPLVFMALTMLHRRHQATTRETVTLALKALARSGEMDSALRLMRKPALYGLDPERANYRLLVLLAGVGGEFDVVRSAANLMRVRVECGPKEFAEIVRAYMRTHAPVDSMVSLFNAAEAADVALPRATLCRVLHYCVGSEHFDHVLGAISRRELADHPAVHTIVALHRADGQGEAAGEAGAAAVEDDGDAGADDGDDSSTGAPDKQ